MVRLILGTMEFARAERESETLEACTAQVQEYLKRHRARTQQQQQQQQTGATGPPPPVLDTALMYQAGGSEKFIGQMAARGDLGLPRRGIDHTDDDAKQQQHDDGGYVEIHTKINPWGPQGLQPASCRQQLTEWSQPNLAGPSSGGGDDAPPPCIDLLYLHAPDHATPIEDTLREVAKLQQEGRFRRLGLSNYAAWEVAEIVGLCRANGWTPPTVYQGMYNALTRDVERELFPCLKRFNIAFFAYNPLAGGLLAGRVNRAMLAAPEADQQPGRFFGNAWAQNYRNRFATPAYFDAVERVERAVAEAFPNEGERPALAEVAMRWLNHHSGLSSERGDGIIIGASTLQHVRSNMEACDAPPLPDSVVQALDDGWSQDVCRNACQSYFR